MLVHPDCAPCLLRRVLFQARLAGNGSESDAVSAAVRKYAEALSPGVCSTDIATAVHRAAYAAMGVEDPYLGLKIRSEEVAERLLPAAEGYIESADDRLAAAAKVAIAGNVMDFGSGISIDGPDLFSSELDGLLAEGIPGGGMAVFEAMLSSSQRVLYALDNCGEDVFDKPLIREIRSRGKEVIGVAKGAPVLNDVTLPDAARIGLDREMDGIVGAGGFAVGLPADFSAELSEAASSADMLLSKGMANYESLSSRPIGLPTAFLLRAKCIPVAGSIGVPVGTSVVHCVP